MTDRTTVTDGDTTLRSSPSPTIMWLPGAALLSIGLWLVSSGAFVPGWTLAPVGLGCLVVGGVAQGVAWGMDIHKERHPE